MTNPPVRVMAEGRSGQFGHAVWLHLVLSEGLSSVEHTEWWHTAAGELDAMVEASDHVAVRVSHGGGEELVARLGPCVAGVTLRHGAAMASVAGSDRRATARALDQVRRFLPQRNLDGKAADRGL